MRTFIELCFVTAACVAGAWMILTLREIKREQRYARHAIIIMAADIGLIKEGIDHAKGVNHHSP